jgi:hypothetical protein
MYIDVDKLHLQFSNIHPKLYYTLKYSDQINLNIQPSLAALKSLS